MRGRSISTSSSRAGFTVLEMVIAGALLALLIGGSFAMIQKESRALSSMARISAARTRVQELVVRLEDELAVARGFVPVAWLLEDVGAGETAEVSFSPSAAFPDRGQLLLSRGTADAELVSYDALAAFGNGVANLTRGARCTEPATHPEDEEVLWAGSAAPIANQTAPLPGSWDGRAAARNGGLFFRGQGSGFVFRLPTDPAGGRNYLDSGQITWGSTFNGVASTNGWSVVYFAPTDTVTEADLGDDLNGDGDRADTFDRGAVRLRKWNDTGAGPEPSDTGLGPAFVLQEQCNWGGDLNNDGFDDPMFLFDEETGRLHVRLFVLSTSAGGRPFLEVTQCRLFLRNSLQE